MPSLFRFLAIAGVISALTFGGLYAAATFFEPESKEVAKTLPGVKVRR